MAKIQKKQNVKTYKPTIVDMNLPEREQNRKILSAYSEIKDMNEARDKALSDERSRLSSAEEKGMQKGMLKIIKNFLDSGMPIEEVAKHTHHTAEELRKLLEQTKNLWKYQ